MALGRMIEPMKRAHLSEVLAIDAQCYPIPWSREVYESELARTGDRFYVVAHHDQVVGHPNDKTSSPKRVVGHGGVAFEKSNAHITTVTVSPDCRGQGIGARLFLALALAARRRKTSLVLEVAVDNPAAQALYRRFGLAPVGVHRGYYADMGLSPDAIVMRADGIHQPDYANRLTNIAVELDCT
ncbi:MAG: GNAT family N-acetyltransferase [bacterium]|nr:GNAT family N-acetyltransferase [bacterium]